MKNIKIKYIIFCILGLTLLLFSIIHIELFYKLLRSSSNPDSDIRLWMIVWIGDVSQYFGWFFLLLGPLLLIKDKVKKSRNFRIESGMEKNEKKSITY